MSAAVPAGASAPRTGGASAGAMPAVVEMANLPTERPFPSVVEMGLVGLPTERPIPNLPVERNIPVAAPIVSTPPVSSPFMTITPGFGKIKDGEKLRAHYGSGASSNLSGSFTYDNAKKCCVVKFDAYPAFPEFSIFLVNHTVFYDYIKSYPELLAVQGAPAKLWSTLLMQLRYRRTAAYRGPYVKDPSPFTDFAEDPTTSEHYIINIFINSSTENIPRQSYAVPSGGAYDVITLTKVSITTNNGSQMFGSRYSNGVGPWPGASAFTGIYPGNEIVVFVDGNPGTKNIPLSDGAIQMIRGVSNYFPPGAPASEQFVSIVPPLPLRASDPVIPPSNDIALIKYINKEFLKIAGRTNLVGGKRKARKTRKRGGRK